MMRTPVRCAEHKKRSYMEAAASRTYLEAAKKFMEVEYATRPSADVCANDRCQIDALWKRSFNAVADWRTFEDDSVVTARYKHGQRQIVAVCVTRVRGGPCIHDHYENFDDTENGGRGECSVFNTCSDTPVVLHVENFCAFPPNHGYGRGLVNHVKDVATLSDVITAVTLNVKIQNVGQAAFYQKQGFVKPRWPRPREACFEMRYDIREPVDHIREKLPCPVKEDEDEYPVDVGAMTPVIPNFIWEVGLLAPGNAAVVLTASKDWAGVHDDVIQRVKACMTIAVLGRPGCPGDGFRGTREGDYIELKRGNQYIWARWDAQKTVTVYYGRLTGTCWFREPPMFDQFIFFMRNSYQTQLRP